MSTASRGLDAALYVSGTLVGLLTGVDFDWTKPVTEFAPMGTMRVTQVLQGVQHYKGKFEHAFIDCTYHTIWRGETICTGSLVPRIGVGGTILGSLVITGGSLKNMKAEESAAIIEEGTFVMYSVTCA